MVNEQLKFATFEKRFKSKNNLIFFFISMVLNIIFLVISMIKMAGQDDFPNVKNARKVSEMITIIKEML